MHMCAFYFDIISNDYNCNSGPPSVKSIISGIPKLLNYCVIFTIYDLKMLPLIAYNILAGSGLDTLELN
jgi:hypothetical protein